MKNQILRRTIGYLFLVLFAFWGINCTQTGPITLSPCDGGVSGGGSACLATTVNLADGDNFELTGPAVVLADTTQTLYGYALDNGTNDFDDGFEGNAENFTTTAPIYDLPFSSVTINNGVFTASYEVDAVNNTDSNEDVSCDIYDTDGYQATDTISPRIYFETLGTVEPFQNCQLTVTHLFDYGEGDACLQPTGGQTYVPSCQMFVSLPAHSTVNPGIVPCGQHIRVINSVTGISNVAPLQDRGPGSPPNPYWVLGIDYSGNDGLDISDAEWTALGGSFTCGNTSEDCTSIASHGTAPGGAFGAQILANNTTNFSQTVYWSFGN
jgi:hypothetical protein